MSLSDIKGAHTDLPIGSTSSSTEEISMATRHIKCRKATRPGSVLAEALKPDIILILKMLHILFKRISEKEQVPTDCKG